MMNNSSSALVMKTLYSDHDARLNLYDLGDQYGSTAEAQTKVERIKELAKSVGCLVEEKHFELRTKEDASWSLNREFFKSPETTLKSKIEHKLVANEVKLRFELEPCLGSGTAFLIGRDLVLTAAHCIYDPNHPNELHVACPRLLIFGFEHKAELKDKKYDYPITFEYKNVYKIKSVFAHALEDNNLGPDWAILKLDREVEKRRPLTINFSAQITDSKKLWMLGHPYGLPLKWAGEARVMKVNSDVMGTDYFEANLAAFKGNSGSPVFFDDDSGQVIGMLCQGFAHDFLPGKEDNVVTEYKPDENEIKSLGYEKSMKMAALTFLKAVLSSINLPSPSQPCNYKDGLSLEGICRKDSCEKNKQLVIVSLGFPNDKVDLNEACYKAQCPHCNTRLDYDDVNILVLSRCTYEIDAQNTNEERILGTFQHRALDDSGGEVRFDVREWNYIELKIRRPSYKETSALGKNRLPRRF